MLGGACKPKKKIKNKPLFKPWSFGFWVFQNLLSLHPLQWGPLLSSATQTPWNGSSMPDFEYAKLRPRFLLSWSGLTAAGKPRTAAWRWRRWSTLLATQATTWPPSLIDGSIMGTELGQWSSESSSVTYESAGGSVMLSRFVSNELRLWCLCLFL